MLNLASNVLFNQRMNSTGVATPSYIRASYAVFPPQISGSLNGLKWVAFFGACMVRILPTTSLAFANVLSLVKAVFPAFFTLYVSKERRSSIQAMQMSNGLTDVTGLWLGHLMFDAMFSTLAATIVIIVFATVTSQFQGLGLFVSCGLLIKINTNDQIVACSRSLRLCWGAFCLRLYPIHAVSFGSVCGGRRVPSYPIRCKHCLYPRTAHF